MPSTTSLVEAVQKKDMTALNDFIVRVGMTEEPCTPEETVAAWETGWHAWEEGRKAEAWDWPAQASVKRPSDPFWEAVEESGRSSDLSGPLWHNTLGLFFAILKATYPWLPGIPAAMSLRDMEEE